jgi:hypothetical protein
LKVRAYYGSTVKFDEWDITKTREFGYHFGIEDELQSLRRIRDGGYIYDVELTYNSPLRMRDALRWELRSITDELGLPYDDFEKEARLRARRNYSTLGEERNLIAAEILDQKGYDAILYDNMGETGGNAIIVWKPEQIYVMRVSRVTKDPAGRGLGLRQQAESSLRSLIREMAGPFDNYAFSDERQTLPNPPPPESNNFLESAALEKILSVINEEEKLDRKTSDLLNGMLRDGLYRDFLRSPDSEVVFRGMTVYPNELRKLGIDQTPRPGEKIEVKGNFLFEPQGGLSSSWTTNRRIASQFSRFKPTTGEKSSYKIEILMTAMVQKNPYNFLSLSPFYPLMFSYGYEEEDEVMGLGEIMFEKAELKRIT